MAKEWLRALVGGHDIMGVAARVEAPKRFLEDFVKTAADCIAEWPHRVHMRVTDQRVITGKCGEHYCKSVGLWWL
jgi:hypothetical protein